MPYALPNFSDLQSYLRLSTAAEQALITDLIAQAQGEIEAAVGKSLTTETVSWYDDAQTLRMNESCQNLLLRYVPVDPTTIVVTDKDGVIVDPTTYRIRLDLGLIQAMPGTFGVPGNTFPNGPYIIACTAGLGTSPTYQTREIQIIRHAIIHYTVYLYQQRTPGARMEKSAGTSVEYELDPDCNLPRNIARDIKRLKGPVYAVL